MLGRRVYTYVTADVECQETSRTMTTIGKVGIVIGDTQVWTNSVDVANRIRVEERRKH